MWTRTEANRYRALIERAMSVSPLTDAEASEVPTMFPAWENIPAGREFKAEDIEKKPRLSYAGKLYLVTGVHKVQADWTPDTAHSLYTEIKYRKGHRVIEDHITTEERFSAGETGIDAEDVVWVSKVDNNVYTPTQYPDNWERRETET